jgi:phage gp37-like protein
MIAAIENAGLARLKAGEARLGYRWKTCETYPADWDAFLKEKRQANAPGVWIGFAGGQRMFEETSGEIRVEASFGIVVFAQHRGNEQARRHGEVRQGVVGSYQLIEDAIGLLTRQTLGLDIAPIEFGRIRHVRPVEALQSMKASMIAADFKTNFLLPVLPEDLNASDPVPFQTFHANWDIPPHGGIDAAPGTHGIQLPDDAHADATDHLELLQ